MTQGFTKKGNYVVALIRAIKLVTTIQVGEKIEIAGYEPALYTGLSSVEGEVQFHGFRLPDGTFLELESDRLTDAMLVGQQAISNAPGKIITQLQRNLHIEN